MNAFLQAGISSSAEPLSQFIRLAVAGMVQQALEQEVTDRLGQEIAAIKALVLLRYRNSNAPPVNLCWSPYR